MISLQHNPATGEAHLLVETGLAKAWISRHRRLTPDFHHVNEVHDWRLWVQRRPDLPPRVGKSPTGLLIESRLRAWLLQRFHCRLSDLRFEELLAIAQGRYLTPRRRMKMKWRRQG